MRTVLAAVAASAVALVPAVMVASPAQATVSATDLTISDAANWEGGKLTFTLTYSGTSAGTYTLATAGTGQTIGGYVDNTPSPGTQHNGVGGGTATTSTDYTAAPSRTTVAFAANTGGASQTATVTVTTAVDGDTTGPDKTVKLVATGDEATPATTYGTGTIWERGSVTYTLRGPSAPIPETATSGVQRTATFTATLSAVASHDVSIPVEAVTDTTSGGGGKGAVSTVSAGQVYRDFDALPTSAAITIPAGQLSGSINVNLWDDKVHEQPLQYFKVQANGSTPLGAAPYGGPQVSSVAIQDDDPIPSVSIGNAPDAAEGSPLVFPIAVSAPSEAGVTVDFTTADGDATSSVGSATDGVDYTGQDSADDGTTITIPAYNMSVSREVATLHPGVVLEGPESVKATLSIPTGSALSLGTPSSATGTIIDIDPGPSFTAAGLRGTGEGLDPADTTDYRSFMEYDTGEPTRTITGVVNTPSLGVPIKIDYTFKDGTATNGVDYKGTAGSIVIPANSATNPTFTIPVKIVGDTYAENPDETFDVVLTSPNSSISAASLTGPWTFTITDEPDSDTVPTWTTGDVSVAEGNSGKTMAKVPVTLSKAVGSDVTFNATVTGTPSATETGSNATTPGDDDYDWPSPATVVIKAGTTTGYLEVPINGDTTYERDESFNVLLAPIGTLVDNTLTSDVVHTARVVIANDDAKPSVTFNNLTAGEGSLLRVNGSINGISQYPYTLAFAVAGGTPDPATPGTDFDAPAAISTWRIPITPGITGPLAVIDNAKFPFDVYATPDTIDEPTETFTVTASDTSAASSSFATSVGTYKITDDPSDVPPAASVEDATVEEDAGSADVEVKLTQVGDTTATTQAIKIPYWTVDGKAKAPGDYAETKGTLSIEPGMMTGTIKVPINNDKLKEGAENFYVKLGTPTSPMGATIAKGTGEVIIKANDGWTDGGDDNGGGDNGGGGDQQGAPSIWAPDKIIGAQIITIKGEAASGSTVELWGAPFGDDDLKYISSGKADDDGKYEFERWIGQGYRFATQANDLNSEETKTWVQQMPIFVASSPSKGMVSLAVQGNPRASGQTVIVQRWVSGKWVNAWRGMTGANNKWMATAKVASGSTHTLRAFVAGYTPDGLLPGYTANKKLTVK